MFSVDNSTLADPEEPHKIPDIVTKTEHAIQQTIAATCSVCKTNIDLDSAGRWMVIVEYPPGDLVAQKLQEQYKSVQYVVFHCYPPEHFEWILD